MENANPIKVLIVDDHPVVREGLSALISNQRDMTVVAEAADGREAVAQFLHHRPDVTLMDLRMPEMDGADAIAAIHEHAPSARVVVLTTYDDDEGIQRSIVAGAKAYLLKDVPRKELLECIRAVYAGHTLIPEAIVTKLAETIGAPQLTVREAEVLKLVYAGESNKEIAALLFISEGTVKSHIHALLGKLDARDRTQAVTIALKRGILQL